MSSIDGRDAATRKAHPIFTGCLNYFPDALLAVADLSKKGNDQHNPGQPLHWAREKSNDHADCLVRHQLDAGKFDTDGVRHSTKVAWRALAQLQLEIEADEKQNKITTYPAPEGLDPYDRRHQRFSDRRKVNSSALSRRWIKAGRRLTDTKPWTTLPWTER